MEQNNDIPNEIKKTEFTKFCMECGSPVEPSADFCYICGSKKVLTVNPDNNRVIMEKGHCPYCNHDNISDAKFCSKCGNRLGDFEYIPRTKKKLTNKDYLAILLTLLPGAFNIFGLGHFVYKKYSRGLMYLCLSAVVLYIMYSSATSSASMLIMIEVIGLVIYLKQSMEIFNLVFRK